MEEINALFHGFSVALTPFNLLLMFIGVTLGVLIGVLPGLGGANGIAILLPLTFTMPPTSAVIMLSCIYWGALFGGAITSILFNIPGEPWSVATTFDGYPLAQKGKAGQALTAAFTSSFVGAFVAGLAFGAATKDELHESLEFTHDAAELASFVVWFMFGAVMLPELANAQWKDFVFAALALTVVRMLPVALVLLGSKLDRATVGVVGWFGPRGLASVVFALLAVDGLFPDDSARVVSIITATVVLSVVLHGASAAPISARYAARHGAAPAQ